MLISLLLSMAPTAQAAGTLYINNVRADGLRDFDFKDVSVHVDENGDIWVDAPSYRIEVSSGGEEAAGVEAGQWWLVSQDNGSENHKIQVIVNGELVQTIASGDAQVVLDLAAYLKHGSNTVVINALPGSTPSGGDLMIYIGAGSNDSGTMVLKQPDVVYSRTAKDDHTGGSRSYTLQIP